MSIPAACPTQYIRRQSDMVWGHYATPRGENRTRLLVGFVRVRYSPTVRDRSSTGYSGAIFHIIIESGEGRWLHRQPRSAHASPVAHRDHHRTRLRMFRLQGKYRHDSAAPLMNPSTEQGGQGPSNAYPLFPASMAGQEGTSSELG